MDTWLKRVLSSFSLELNTGNNNIFFQLPYELEEAMGCMCFSPWVGHVSLYFTWEIWEANLMDETWGINPQNQNLSWSY